MLYQFKSKAGADVIMLSESGDAVLRSAGREPAASGIFQAADLPSLMATLEAAIASAETPADDPDAAATGAAAVSIRQRAWPLLDLMRASQRAGVDIVWGV